MTSGSDWVTEDHNIMLNIILRQQETVGVDVSDRDMNWYQTAVDRVERDRHLV